MNLNNKIYIVKRLFIFISRYFYAVLSCSYLFAAGFLIAKHRPLLTTICTHFGFDWKPIKPIIPRMKLSQIFREANLVKIREPIDVQGNISLLEVMVINNLIVSHNPKKLFEIGTFNGRTTLNMASNCVEQALLYTIDLPEKKLDSIKLPRDFGEKEYIGKEKTGSRYIGTDCEKKIHQLFGDSATFNFSPFFDKIDFIFIDASHSYEYVLNDSRLAIKLLRNMKGIILWHDYVNWPGVTKALNELYLRDVRFKGLRHIEGTTLVCLIAD